MFGKLLTNQKIAHKIVKPYVYKALREGLKTHDNGKIQNLRGFGSLSLRGAANNLNNWRVANPNGDINIFSGLYIKRNGNIGLDD